MFYSSLWKTASVTPISQPCRRHTRKLHGKLINSLPIVNEIEDFSPAAYYVFILCTTSHSIIMSLKSLSIVSLKQIMAALFIVWLCFYINRLALTIIVQTQNYIHKDNYSQSSMYQPY